jgi:hypothetical protein
LIQSPGKDLARIYPNPAKDMIYAELHSNGEISHVSLQNIHGQNVLDMDLASGKRSVAIPVAALPEGIYFIQMSTASGMITQKIVIAR